MTKTNDIEAKVRARVEQIKDELNTLAIMGATPLWSSFIVRLNDLVEDLFGQQEG
jgi:hypothetical protein